MLPYTRMNTAKTLFLHRASRPAHPHLVGAKERLHDTRPTPGRARAASGALFGRRVKRPEPELPRWSHDRNLARPRSPFPKCSHGECVFPFAISAKNPRFPPSGWYAPLPIMFGHDEDLKRPGGSGGSPATIFNPRNIVANGLTPDQGV